MNSKNFVDEFNLSVVKEEMFDVTDYERFKNKELLDLLRSRIIQNLIDDNIGNQTDVETFIKDEIESSLSGYDLTIEQRSYIYNLIENAIYSDDNIDQELKNKILIKSNKYINDVYNYLYGIKVSSNGSVI